MAGYYYLMAQLPSLSENSAPAISYHNFVELAGRFLSAGDFLILHSLSLTPPKTDEKKSGSSVVDAWYSHERALRFALARVRAGKLGKDNSAASAAGMEFSSVSEIISMFSGAASAAKNAAAMDNPLEAELYLDRVRFFLARELGSGHFYDSEAVFAYALMLLIRERSCSFSAEAGRSEYMDVYHSILSGGNSGS